MAPEKKMLTVRTISHDSKAEERELSTDVAPVLQQEYISGLRGVLRSPANQNRGKMMKINMTITQSII